MSDDKVILLCARVRPGEPLYIADNLTGRCDACGHTVQFRPHAPAQRVLRCLECALELMQPDDEVVTPPRMWADFVDYLKRRQH